MIHVRLATEEDREGWNRVVYESPEATYAHTWEWKEVLEKGLGVKTLCLVAIEDNQIVGVYPGFFSSFGTGRTFSFLRGYRILLSPFDLTWDYGGPCVVSDARPKILEELVKGMEKFAYNMKGASIRVSPFEGDKLKHMLLNKGYRISPRLTSIIDLTVDEERLWKGLKKRTRTPISQAKRYGVSVIQTNDDSALKDFYACMLDVAQHTGMFCPPYLFFKMLLETMHPKKMVRIYLAKYENKTVGGALALYFRDMMVTRYWAVLQNYHKLRSNNLLVWALIEEGKMLGYAKCDLGGIPSDEEDGIFIFKSGWGGDIKSVEWYVKDIRFELTRNLKRKLKNIRL